MNADDTIYRYIDTRSLGKKSKYCYVSILRIFETYISKNVPRDRAPSMRSVRAWLQEEINRSPLKSVVHRASVISHFLDWKAAMGGPTNPLAKLQSRYGRPLNPIIRALLEEDYQGALERLQPLPDFGSVLGPMMGELIERKRSLGYRYNVKGRDLRRFDRFLQRRPDLTGAELPALLEAWRQSVPGMRHELRVQQCGRALTQSQHRKDISVPILSIERDLQRRVIAAERKPYIFTETEVGQLFEAARTFPTQGAPLRPIAVTTMLTLAYCVGLRVGEIVRLTLKDVDLDEGLLEVRESKFFKSRRLPLAPTVIEALSHYLRRRAAAGAPTSPEAPLWWTTLRRQQYSYGQVEKLLMRVMRHAGLKSDRGKKGPRVHDLRHTFVAHRMLHWYRSGVDPQSRLPHLATYLGHKDIKSTLVYLNITPEVLRQASERYRKHGVHALHLVGVQS